MVFVVSPGLVNAGHNNVVLTTELNGRSEVSDRPGIAGDPDGKGEAYVFGIDGDGTTLCYVVLVKGVQLVPVPAMTAHIHEVRKGSTDRSWQIWPGLRTLTRRTVSRKASPGSSRPEKPGSCSGS